MSSMIASASLVVTFRSSTQMAVTSHACERTLWLISASVCIVDLLVVDWDGALLCSRSMLQAQRPLQRCRRASGGSD